MAVIFSTVCRLSSAEATAGVSLTTCRLLEQKQQQTGGLLADPNDLAAVVLIGETCVHDTGTQTVLLHVLKIMEKSSLTLILSTKLWGRACDLLEAAPLAVKGPVRSVVAAFLGSSVSPACSKLFRQPPAGEKEVSGFHERRYALALLCDGFGVEDGKVLDLLEQAVLVSPFRRDNGRELSTAIRSLSAFARRLSREGRRSRVVSHLLDEITGLTDSPRLTLLPRDLMILRAAVRDVRRARPATEDAAKAPSHTVGKEVSPSHEYEALRVEVGKLSTRLRHHH
ncbi:hypothetical protein AGDE_16057 [Angomonas deanei]|nr:hypothetical protein AGDE_16057 [Angomonas deanei]|eukprot:EPY17809.1 hypothetical protein AGDE_16057 [Angomonas deanei]